METDEDFESAVESIKESEQQLKVKMSTPKLSSGEQSDSIDYDTPAQ